MLESKTNELRYRATIARTLKSVAWAALAASKNVEEGGVVEVQVDEVSRALKRTLSVIEKGIQEGV